MSRSEDAPRNHFQTPSVSVVAHGRDEEVISCPPQPQQADWLRLVSGVLLKLHLPGGGLPAPDHQPLLSALRPDGCDHAVLAEDVVDTKGLDLHVEDIHRY